MATAGVQLFSHGTATPQGVRRSLPRSSASGRGLAAWSSMPDPQPGVLGVGGGLLTVVCVGRVWGAAGEAARLEQRQWQRNRGIWGHSPPRGGDRGLQPTPAQRAEGSGL